MQTGGTGSISGQPQPSGTGTQQQQGSQPQGGFGFEGEGEGEFGSMPQQSMQGQQPTFSKKGGQSQQTQRKQPSQSQGASRSRYGMPNTGSEEGEQSGFGFGREGEFGEETGSKSSRFQNQKGSSKQPSYFEFSSERFQPTKKVQKKSILLPELDLEEENDYGSLFADLQKNIKKINKLTSKSKLLDNAYAVATSLEEICSEAELDCEDVLDEAADVLSSKKLKAKDIKKVINGLYSDVYDIWTEESGALEDEE